VLTYVISASRPGKLTDTSRFFKKVFRRRGYPGNRRSCSGCGGGFPTLPIAITRRDISVTALDSTAKKLAFVEQAADALGLANVNILPRRAEDAAADDCREMFDVVTARAVARLNVLSELCLPFLKVGGYFIAMKAALADEELDEASRAITTLGGKLVRVDSPELVFSGERMSRSNIIVQKKSHTPQIYPRNYSQITKKPL